MTQRALYFNAHLPTYNETTVNIPILVTPIHDLMQFSPCLVVLDHRIAFLCHHFRRV